MSRQTLIVIAIASALAGLTACGNAPQDTQKASASASASVAKGEAKTGPEKLIIASEDVLNLQNNALASGPVVTGSIQPERKADLRAEVSTVVLQVLKENGEAVKRGDVIVRLDETSIRDNLNSANDAARNAALALDQVERNLQRLKTLRASGMTSMQALDDAEVRRNAAQSEVSAAKARAVQAQQQLQRTIVRAPFDGVVSERKVSAGDTALAGKELVKVVDPSSMRFVGRVSADKIGLVKIGQAVSFRINGYANQEFRGKVTRLDPAANDVTRQVEVLVAFADSKQPRVSGLYAEGNIESETVSALMLPEAAIVKSGDKSFAWRVQGKTLNKVELALGSRDVRTGNYEVRRGVVAGDVIMRNPNSSLKDGQLVEMANTGATKTALANTTLAMKD
ncbi:efflux RND transporter periplasmic adaptor subunit [Undibacterium fentianense]|uniref:Efflux RND transporter periplasmic adaptor subunit n=1 Tax=Undibacterium fentianense TaxID=2828728 RepID=A0A941E3U0_9BURK|nr:efflux RND transporter periplasmic adaptor subunit [Undibacterium fentianense]MBR7800677.1 efflux RND transporter periplasmic adaptor subunit [Undibacterium fentianense]